METAEKISGNQSCTCHRTMISLRGIMFMNGKHIFATDENQTF